jgi:hypothetical protein
MTLALLLPLMGLLAQVPGHSTVPQDGGPTVRDSFAVSPRDEEPVLVQAEQLRLRLSVLARQFKKMRKEEKAAQRAAWLAALEEARRVLDAVAAAPPPG